jgi:exodeoxyribonuclease VII large subunit
MFRTANSRLRFRPEDGMRVLAHGNVSVYGPGGTYQLYPDRMEPDGIGSLFLAFEQLKTKLAQEGLFSESLKRPLPLLPRKIGVVTSATGAVLRDIRNVLFRRFPRATLVLAPAAVQGQEAPGQLMGALGRLSRVPGVDVIVLARGGGSLEDLWPFNDEALARAIRACPVPVVSAVGHETDFTIADFVADLRAPTPSAAAELVVPNEQELRALLADSLSRAGHAMRRRMEVARLRVDRLAGRPIFRHPMAVVEMRRQQLDGLQQRVRQATMNRLERARATVGNLSGKLDALSPLRVLARGYATVADEAGHLVTKVENLHPGDVVRLRWVDGDATARIEALGKEQSRGR